MVSIERRESLSDCSDSEFDNEEDEELNEYSGYEPPLGVSCLSERVSSDISPQEFFTNYIQRRQPAVISGLLKDSDWKGDRWTASYLLKNAGDADVLVEDRKNTFGNEYIAFGRAPKVAIKYGDIVNALESGENRYYLTTQDLERFVNNCDELNIPRSVIAEPLCHLKGDYPLQPSILGNLIPHQISLWQGLAGKGQYTSTGLHHDFHDNLYILIQGRKRFRLFPPSAARHLHLAGQPSKLHKNGLIVYSLAGGRSRFAPVRADGAPMAAVAKHNRDVAEKDLSEAEEQLSALKQVETNRSDYRLQLRVAEKKVEECEERLDAALEELLRYASDEEDVDSDVDDNNDPSDGLNENADGKPVSKRHKSDAQTPPENDNKSDTQELPNHFCRAHLPAVDTVDPKMMFADLVDSDSIGCLVVELQAGEMLYLPASWFHEVSSFDSSVKSEYTNGHLALNYWMYPPDSDKYEKPYLDDFWPRRWENIKMNGQQYSTACASK